jgi:hypothetical protein
LPPSSGSKSKRSKQQATLPCSLQVEKKLSVLLQHFSGFLELKMAAFPLKMMRVPHTLRIQVFIFLKKFVITDMDILKQLKRKQPKMKLDSL